MTTKFKDLLSNIEAIKNNYKGSIEELMDEEICAQITAMSLPNTFVGIKGSVLPIAVAATYQVGK